MSANDNKAIVRRYAEEIWNRGNLAALPDFVPDDYVLREPGAPDIVGPSGFRDYISAVRTAFPDSRLEIEDMVAEGDSVAWRWRMQGTHLGEFMNAPPSGRRVTTTGIAIYRFADGKIVERFGESDIVGLLDQLGLLPSALPSTVSEPRSADGSPAVAKPATGSGSATVERRRRPNPRREGDEASAAVEARSLTKRFGEVTAVDDVSFAIGAGRVVGFLGPNGAGKTTTLRMLLGLVRPSSGSSLVMGRPYRQLDEPRRTVGAVLEASSYHPGRSARNHLRVLAAAAAAPSARVDELLQTVELDAAADRRVGTFSLGMRRRLGLASALLGEPRVLILDEPTNGLDPEGVRWLRAFLHGLAAEGRTILISSHALAEVAQIADEILVISRGRLLAHAPLSELTARIAPAVKVHTPEPERLREVLVQAASTAEVVLPDGYVVARGITPEAVAELAAAHAIGLEDVRVETPSLEDAFLEIVAGRTS